jgi:hypothetical protein|tara:strand:+ start:1214 stop:1381 length:168 start_codon:yes stop_codon:yes gene_type:complete
VANLKHVLQWFWGRDWLNNKVKNIYFGPRLDWMKLVKEPKKRKKRNENKKKKKQK